MDDSRLRLVYFGSGAFGLPTLRRLVELHDVALVVTRPDQPAGRRRHVTPTPIAEFAQQSGLEVFKPVNPNDPEAIEHIRKFAADAFIVIAYGHKLSEALLRDIFAINLHGSLLPKYRGAAPVQWAVLNNERETGVSVIGLDQRMDAGGIYAQQSTPIDPMETAGELHDRLAELGPDVIAKVLNDLRSGSLHPWLQDESQATRAPKLTKADGTLPHGFDQPADFVRARIHGLTPWPGCTVRLNDQELKLLRVKVEEGECEGSPGRLLAGGLIACASGAIRLLEVQPPGGRAMRFDEYARGHSVSSDARCTPV